VEHDHPRAVVLDLMLPRVDGFEVLRTLRERPSTRDLPVIVLTAKELTEEDRHVLASNAERVILKQALALDDLRAEIGGLLAAHRGRGATFQAEEDAEP
jgi:CheY-like chemotaxis protein